MSDEEDGLVDTTKKVLDSVNSVVTIVTGISGLMSKRTKIKVNNPVARLEYDGGHYDLYLGKNKIGRSREQNNIEINHCNVSRHHAVIECFSDGRVILEDVGSSNGTFVNSKSRITRPIQLTNGVEIVFGKWSATFNLY
ncbi:MAG: FHA domain-containing protein [Thiolinea sp.]